MLEECDKLYEVRYRYIIRCHGFINELQTEANNFSLILEYANHGTVSKVLEQNRTCIAEKKAEVASILLRMTWCEHLTKAVNYLHNDLSDVMVHKDIKPCNLLQRVLKKE